MKVVALPALIALSLSFSAIAGGDIDAGKQKSAPCAACHGADGNAGVDPQYPRLAGQYRDYLVQALREYRDGERTNAIMVGFATPLSDQDVENLAEYYSSLPGKLVDLHEAEGRR